MSFAGGIVEALLNLIGLELPWRRLAAICLVLLAGIGYLDRGALDSGISAWVRSEQCAYEQSLVAATGGPTLPKMVVVHAASVCVVRRFSPKSENAVTAQGN